ncbi:MAG TPA: VWA domain-containing protein, partial [Actinomycetota bacterium]|nr:VWA domain-containing protein [Actinomycetota bacterium]
LLQDEFRRRLQWIRDAILRETRMRTARIRDPDYVARYVVDPVPEETNFFSAATDAAELRRAVRPLARKLATRVAMKRRRARRGHIDMRRTMRHSLSTGGVPIETPFKHRTPHRPELLLLCDVSSSVARFSRFTLMLTHALRAQFQKVRTYAFINTLADITDQLQVEDFGEAMESIGSEAAVDGYDGRTDYGTVFRELAEDHGDAFGPKTTVLVLGDARSNYRARYVDHLKAVRKQVRHIYWLNPEPVSDWDIGDSAASEYAACVDKMVEVRNLRQLQEFIATEL